MAEMVSAIELITSVGGGPTLVRSYRPYPRTIIFEIMSLTSGWQIAKGGKGVLFYSRIVVNNGKRQRERTDSHDAEAILAHYRVDKPFKRFYKL